MKGFYFYEILGNERSVISSAAMLNIHRNTLTYRVERMQEMFGIDYSSEVKRIRYYLSALILGAA